MKSLRESFEENYEPVEVPCSNRRGFRIRYRPMVSVGGRCCPAETGKKDDWKCLRGQSDAVSGGIYPEFGFKLRQIRRILRNALGSRLPF